MTARRSTRIVVVAAAAALAAGVLGSCSLLFPSPERTFASNQEALDALAREAGYVVDPALHRLIRAELFEDSLTFQYRGVRHVGDAAWVVRFSAKSSEQDPDSVADITTILPVLAEGRERFEIVEDGKRDVGGVSVLYARYRFDSPVRSAEAQPLRGRGILVAFATRAGDDPLVYHIKLDNQGDRDDLTWSDLVPFLAPILGETAGL